VGAFTSHGIAVRAYSILVDRFSVSEMLSRPSGLCNYAHVNASPTGRDATESTAMTLHPAIRNENCRFPENYSKCNFYGFDV